MCSEKPHFNTFIKALKCQWHRQRTINQICKQIYSPNMTFRFDSRSTKIRLKINSTTCSRRRVLLFNHNTKNYPYLSVLYTALIRVLWTRLSTRLIRTHNYSKLATIRAFINAICTSNVFLRSSIILFTSNHLKWYCTSALCRYNN